jgi:hypothetical protein
MYLCITFLRRHRVGTVYTETNVIMRVYFITYCIAGNAKIGLYSWMRKGDEGTWKPLLRFCG